MDRISVRDETEPKNIRLADKIYIFGWNSAVPQKLRGSAARDIKFWRGGWRRRRRGLYLMLDYVRVIFVLLLLSSLLSLLYAALHTYEIQCPHTHTIQCIHYLFRTFATKTSY